MTVHYTEGPARAVIRGETVVVLPDGPDDVLLRELWTELADATDGVAAALGVLTSVPGGLRAVPPFAVVSVQPGGAAHVAVRGAGVDVTVTTAGGPVQVTGQDVVSWSERVIEDPASFVVAAGSPVSSGGLPVESAVVPAASVRRVLAEEPVTGPTSGQAGRDGALPGGAPVVDGVPEVGGTSPVPPAPVPGHAPADLPAFSFATPVDAPPSGPGTSPPGASDPGTSGPAEGGLPFGGPAPSDPSPASPVPEATQVGGDDEYEHLFGETIMRSVEDAAVRTLDEDEEEDDGPAGTPAGAGTGPGAVPPAETVAPPPAPPEDAAPAPGAADPADPADDGSGRPGLISSIPGSFPGASPAPGGTPGAAHRAAAVNEALNEAGELDDHDGHTVMQSDLAALRGPGGPAPSTPAAEPPPVSGGVQILAVTCPDGHANPPARSTCRTCGEGLAGEPSTAARPPLGRLVVTTGSAQVGAAGARGDQVVQLDRGVVVGRRPRTSTTSASEIPRLVTVSSPNQDISRSHLEISLEEWHVLVADMATTNGTTLIRPGQPPRRLHPNEKEIVADGDVVDLGDGVTLRFEGIW